MRTILDTSIQNVKLAIEDIERQRPQHQSQSIEKAMDYNTVQIAELVRKLLVVPDKLLTAQLSLRPLSHGDPNASEREASQTIADACDLMHSALADVVEVARNLTQLPAIDEARPGFHRVTVDSYYQQMP